MSTYRGDSEITRVNEAPTHEWITVSDDFFAVASTALSIGELSGGAYDVTIAPLVNRWGFGPDLSSRELPSEEEVRALLTRVGQGKLALDPGASAVMKLEAISLDFSSLAKGHAVDVVANWLATENISDYLVEVGGEMRLSGRSGRGDLWRIAIEQPQNGNRSAAQALALSTVAVATSGDYRNYFERDGKRYSHTIDPRTGYPVEHDLVSVTVIHDSAMKADGWATALTVLGAERAFDLAQEQGLAVYFIQRKDNEYVSRNTASFEPYLDHRQHRE